MKEQVRERLDWKQRKGCVWRKWKEWQWDESDHLLWRGEPRTWIWESVK